MRKILLIALLILSACNGTKVMSVNEPPKDYKGAVKGYLQITLKDPDSIKSLHISEPVGQNDSLGITGGYIYRYKSCVSINAKNSYGAYDGAKSYTFVFSGDNVFETYDGCYY